MKTQIPDKLYFKIGEVAKMAEVPTHVLRYWESEFTAIKPKRANSKQRLYRRQDVELILNIKFLLHQQGYTIAGAKKLIESGQPIDLAAAQHTAADHDTAPEVIQDLPQRLKAIKAELKELQNILISKKQ